VRRNRALGGQTDQEAPREVARDPEVMTPALSREEEAVLIAERLAALVESRRGSTDRPIAPQRTAGPDLGAESSEAAEELRATAPSRGSIAGARHSGRLLGNLLLTRGFIVESELRYALARQAETGGPIGQILVELGLITERDLVELLAEQLRMHVIDPARVDVDRDVIERLSKEEARRRAVLPLRLVDGQIDVAVAEPTDDRSAAELTGLLGAPLRLFLATRADIDSAIDRYYD